MEFIGQLGLPNIELEAMSYQHSFQTRSFLVHNQFLENTDFGKNLLKRLSEDPRVIALDGQMVSRGDGASRFEVTTLAIWFIWCANSYGEQFANQQLERWLNTDEVEVLNSLWVLGVEAEESIELADGYVIQTIADMPDSDEKEYFSKIDFSFLSRTNLPKCAITKRQKIRKMWSNVPPVSSKLAGEFRSSCTKLYELAFILNSVSGVTCVPHFQTAYRPATTPIGYFGGSGGGAPMFDVSTLTLSKISAALAPTINEMFCHFQSKSESEKARLQLILSRLSQAKRRMQIEDQMLDIGIALEMLLLEENEKDQLSLQFRIRGSWLLGQSFDDRLEKSNLFNQIYSARSSVAHSGALHKNDAKKLEIVRANLNQYFELAEATIQKIIVDGSPVWEHVLLRGLAPGLKISK